MKRTFFIVLMAAAALTACRENTDEPEQPLPDGNEQPVDKTTAREFFNQNGKESNFFVLNVDDLPTTVTCAEGTQVYVRPGVFTKDGQPVTGEFQLEVREFYKASDIVKASTNTNLRGFAYMETDGFIYVNATQNGEQLDTHLSNNLIVTVPTDKVDGSMTHIWKGTEDNGDGQFEWDAMDWEDVNEKDDEFRNEWGEVWGEGQTNIFVTPTSWSSDGNFKFCFCNLGWYNCDMLYGQGGQQRTTVTVHLTGEVGELASYMGYTGNTFVFFLGKGYPVIAQLYTKVNDTTVMSYENSMPIGAKGQMIAFSIRDGVFSLAVQEVEITENLEMTMELKKVTKEYLEAILDALDTKEE
jgi:hypothetical protein